MRQVSLSSSVWDTADTADIGWSIGLTVSNKTNKIIAVGAVANRYDDGEIVRKADLLFVRGITLGTGAAKGR